MRQLEQYDYARAGSFIARQGCWILHGTLSISVRQRVSIHNAHLQMTLQTGDWTAEGRLEADGTLACSYHGWRFGPDGKCTAIPQATDKKAERTACASSRSAATTYPVQVCC